MIDSGVVLTSSRYNSKKINGLQPKKLETRKRRSSKFGVENSLPSLGLEYLRCPCCRMSTFEKRPTLLRKSATLWVFWKFFSICYRIWWTALVFVNDFPIFLSINSTKLIRSSVVVHRSIKIVSSLEYFFIKIEKISNYWK